MKVEIKYMQHMLKKFNSSHLSRRSHSHFYRLYTDLTKERKTYETPHSC